MVEERLSAIKNILDGMKLQTDEVRFYIPASKFTLRPEVNLPFCQTEITLLFFFFYFFLFLVFGRVLFETPKRIKTNVK
jgi:hypothetical protein